MKNNEKNLRAVSNTRIAFAQWCSLVSRVTI